MPALSFQLTPAARRGALAAFCVAALAMAPGSASAACAKLRPSDDAFDTAARSTTVFLGVAQDGDTAFDLQLVSPATFKVERYLAGKRKGPTQQVATAITKSANGSVGVASEGLTPMAGDMWLIAGVSVGKGKPLAASTCDGFSRRADPSVPPTITIGAAEIVPSLADLRGRPLYDPAPPKLPAGTTSLTLRGVDAMRLMHHGKSTKLRERAGSWRLRGASTGDRVYWLDDAGIWSVTIG